jgi:hypothetical protein
MTSYCCTNCGFWQKRFETPATCPVCEDFRHPLPPDGYSFLTNDAVDDRHETRLTEVLPDVWQIATKPAIGVGSFGLLIVTDEGNLHFEGAGLYDDRTLDAIDRLGGVRWQSFSHSHVLGCAWRVNERFKPTTIVQEAELAFSQALRVSFPFDSGWRLSDDLELIHTGGHTPGHCVLYWKSRRAIFCGDALKFELTSYPVGPAKTISTHKAFDAHIPLTHGDVRRYRALFAPIDFDIVVTPWEVVPAGGKSAAMKLFEAQLAGEPFADPMPLTLHDA